MNVKVYLEKPVTITPDDLMESMDQYDAETIAKIAVSLGRYDKWSTKVSDEFLREISKLIAKKLKVYFREHGADKEYIDACNKILEYFDY